ncbi:MAG: energy-coupling factor transporter transmembrane protein EcfT [Leptolyngbya sp. SIOISBB]|nr:energy-coupling factor transporter transmembrane protein EcfT [Leptolyngbya sp. SIOISBB]
MPIASATKLRPNVLAQVNPFLKIGLSFGIIGVALILQQTSAMTGLVSGLLFLLLLAQLRISPLGLLYAGLTLTVFAVSSAWISGDWSQALFSTLRLLAILLPAPVLALTTPPAMLIRALQTLRLPSFLTLSLMLIWRFFPLIQQEVQRIWEANQLRGIDLRRQPRQWFSGLMVPLVFQMVTYADDVTVGLQTRGYDPAAPRSCSHPIRWQRCDTLFCLGTLLWLGAVCYLEWVR